MQAGPSALQVDPVREVRRRWSPLHSEAVRIVRSADQFGAVITTETLAGLLEETTDRSGRIVDDLITLHLLRRHDGGRLTLDVGLALEESLPLVGEVS